MRNRVAFLACGALSLCSDALAQVEVRRVATYGDPESTIDGGFLTEADDAAIGSGGLIAYIAEASDGFASTIEVVRVDDAGNTQTIAYSGQVVDGTTLGNIHAPLTVAGSLVLFEASASPQTSLYAWDAGNGLRRVISRDDALPTGGESVDDLDDAHVNVLGHVTFQTSTQHVFVGADGTVSTALRVGQAVPGFASYNVAGLGTSFLHDDGTMTIEVNGTDGSLPMIVETFILHGPVGGLTVAASTLDLAGPAGRQIRLLGGSPSGQIAYATIDDDGTTDGVTRQIHVGAAGAATVISNLAGQSTQDLGNGYSFDGAFNASRLMLADGNELAFADNLDHSGTLVQGVVAFRDGVWSVVGASDAALPGAASPTLVELLGINPAGQVAIAAGAGLARGLWRYTPGAGTTRIGSMGDDFDVGQSEPEVATLLGTPPIGRSAISDDGDMPFFVGWDGPAGVPTTSVFTTGTGATTDAVADLSIEVIGIDEIDRGHGDADVEFRVTNQGPDATAFDLRFTPDSGGSWATTYDRLGSEESVRFLETFSLGWEGGVEVVPLDAVDTDLGDNTATLSVVDRERGCDVSALPRLGWPPLLMALVLALGRRTPRSSTTA